MRKSKLGRIFLAAVLALTLGASSALAAMPPMPVEYVDGTAANDGSVTLSVSFDVDAAKVAVAQASDKNAKLYAPEFKSLKAFTGGIKETLATINDAAGITANIDFGNIKYSNLIGYFIYTFYNSGNSKLNVNALKMAQALGVIEDVAEKLTDSDFVSGTLTLTAPAATDVFTLSNIAGAPTAAAATELTLTSGFKTQLAAAAAPTISTASGVATVKPADGGLVFTLSNVAEIADAAGTTPAAGTIAAGTELTITFTDGSTTTLAYAATAATKTLAFTSLTDGTSLATALGTLLKQKEITYSTSGAYADKTKVDADHLKAAATAFAAGTFDKTALKDLAAKTQLAADAAPTISTASGVATVTPAAGGLVFTLSNVAEIADAAGTTPAAGTIAAGTELTITFTDGSTTTLAYAATAATKTLAFTSLTDGLLTLTAAAITDVFTLSNIAGAPTAAAITELSFTDDAGGFWNAAAENYSAFKLMLPDIAKWVADNPTATPAEFFEEFSTKEIYAPAYAAVNYVETFASKDELADGNFVLNWAVSTDAGYPKATQPPVKAYLLKDESVTIKPELAAASVVDSKNKATSIKPDTRIFRVEVASFDKGKPVYGPEDVTNGLTIDKAFVEKNPSLLVRVMFTSKGNQDVMTNSVGILKEEQDEEGNGGTLPVGTLKLDPVAGYATANTALFTALAEGYPYFVEFPLQLAVSFDTAGGSGTTTAETYALKAGSIDLVGSDGKTLTVAANTKYVTNQDTAAKDALWTAAPVVFKVSSDQFASFEITVSTDYAVVAVNDSEGGDVKVDGKKIEVLGIEDIYTVILSADLVASSDAKTISTDSGYFAITVDVASVSVAPVVPGETSPSVPGETSPEVPGETSPEVPGTETEPVAADAAETTTDASGNTVAAPGQPIANAFTGSNGASAVSSLINSATAAEMAGAADVAGALGLDEDEIGDATKGYKAIGFKMTQATMPAEGTPLFVIVRKGSTNHVGFGYVPKRREGFETILAVLFSLFRDPADTTNYMTVDAGDNTVAATDSDGEVADASAAVNRVVFVTADGDALQVKTDGTVPLQGQDAKGAATEIEQGDDDDDNNGSTSRHGGGSSGCDAGFGLIALAAIALAARKVRK